MLKTGSAKCADEDAKARSNVSGWKDTASMTMVGCAHAGDRNRGRMPMVWRVAGTTIAWLRYQLHLVTDLAGFISWMAADGWEVIGTESRSDPCSPVWGDGKKETTGGLRCNTPRRWG